MATELELQLPELDVTQSIEVASFTPVALAAEMVIKDALKCKNNSLVIAIAATAAGTITLKAGDNYPNAMLGDLAIPVAVGTNIIRLQDISRFENRDGSVALTNTGATGTIYATGKRAGITPADKQ